MPLHEYARKRNFAQTPEPREKKPVARGERGGFFCVQRHDATRLHYDFRLEVNGVLVSWAVPKGPSLDPARKALAMKVEDHPLDYGTFEGNIPEGNYGAGSVMLWDQGTYEVLGEATAEEQVARGDFKFQLHGTKLNGSFAVVRMKRGGKGNEWLLIKKHDEFAVPDYDIQQYAVSVSTGRTQEEIAANEGGLKLEDLPGARKAVIPANIEPMLATLVAQPPDGSDWLYEIKWDGVRALCRIHQGKLEIHSRRGNRAERQYPEFEHLPAEVRAKSAWLDGEICVLDEHGRARFDLIQPRIGANSKAVPQLTETNPATLLLFDVLYADGFDLRGAALEQRKRVLQTLVTPSDRVRISEAFETDGEHMFEAARQMGLEGIIAKNKTSRYESRRSRAWVKMKVLNEQEFVIAGFTKGERIFGALVLGVREDGALRHVGQVGTGFDQKQMQAIHRRLQPLIVKTSPFPEKPKIKDVTWVKPELVCQVRFLEWTKDGMLRAPVFIGLREDKEPKQVVRETAQEIDRHRVKFTNLDKVYFPKDGWKKRDLLEFYDRAA
ncbi:MAG: non-homologous end-joining DNA ligase, partial [Bryobacteraceae bacterium]